MLDAAPWQNPEFALDVTHDGTVRPQDALVVINRLLQVGIGPVPEVGSLAAPEYYYDTNGDNYVSPADVGRIINRLMAPTTVELDTLMPYTADLTPRLKVTATSPAAIADGTQVRLDVDLNNDGTFGAGELNYMTTGMYHGLAEFALAPGLPAMPDSGPYDVKMRARVLDSQAVEGASDVETLNVDTRYSDALENYVHAFDPSYNWQLSRTINGTGYTAYILKMTSQTWRTAEEVDKPVWQHWVEVVVPAGPIATTSLLYISGGNNDFSSVPNSVDPLLVATALADHAVSVRLRTVPSEPLVFKAETPTRSRSEDEIIAYSLDQYFQHVGQASADGWPVLLAMAKSAVRAMDTIQAFIPTVRAGAQIEDFVVTGYSKRGWTTWLTAASDDRVKAIIPGVFDNLNQGPQMVHHVEVYGFFSEQVQDYTDLRIFERMKSPEAQLLSQIVDPYRYLHNGRFEMPKLVLNGSGDEFFVSDSAQFYFDDLPGEDNYLRYFPNAGHGLDATAAYSTITFLDAMINDRALPKFSWTVSADNTIHVSTVDTPSVAKLWYATNTTSRDFRHGYHPDIIWNSIELADQGGGAYEGERPMPPTGATAYFIELTFPSAIAGMPYVFTTEIRVNSELPLHPWPYDVGGEVISAVVPADLANADPPVPAHLLVPSVQAFVLPAAATSAESTLPGAAGQPVTAAVDCLAPTPLEEMLTAGDDDAVDDLPAYSAPEALALDAALDELADELLV